MEKVSVLIVDDDQGVRNFLCEILQVNRYMVFTAKDGVSALEILGREVIDIVLLDIGLPDINGIDLLKKIKEIYPDIIIALVTGEVDLESALRAYDYGASGYFTKPINSGEFLFRLKSIWEKHLLEDSFRDEQEKLREANDELSTAYAQLQKTQSSIVHQEKMATIGQLAAGVAHEINNPVGFVTSNLTSLGSYFNKLAAYVKILEESFGQIAGPEESARLHSEKRALKIAYVLDDVPELLAESLEGTERVKKIVQNLKCFSRTDDNVKSEADINECLESTLNIVWNELKYKCKVTKEFADLPRVKCIASQLNQVFMNLMVNAGHAIKEKGEILIKSSCDAVFIYVEISDTGCGIPQKIADKIFEPFFTTKDAGKGTGLGMSIALDIIKKHDGEITFTSEVGKGSHFLVKLPITQE